MSSISIKKDLSTLTTVEENAIGRLLEKISLCIVDAIAEAKSTNDDIVDIDLSFGHLMIKLSDEAIKYKFVPSAKLDKSIGDISSDYKSDLTRLIDSTLVSRLTNIYKSLL